VVIVCATRAAELRRAGSHVKASALGVAAFVAMLACGGLIAFGLHVMVAK
jgi:hypothetical protein